MQHPLGAPGARLRHLAEVGSTMTVARAWALAGAAAGSLVLADSQRAGRGRHGRSWISPPGAGLWCTLILRPRPPPGGQLAELGLVAGLAVQAAVVALGARQVRLKWPNDLLLGQRKLAGILLERVDPPQGGPLVLVGIGVNLARCADLGLPEALGRRTVGLQDVPNLGTQPVARLRRRLLPLVRRTLWHYHGLWAHAGLLPLRQRWARADALHGRWVRARGVPPPNTGVAWGLGPGGALRLRTARGDWAWVHTGEVEQLQLDWED